MNKIKKSFFKFGILLFSFLLISCDDKLEMVYHPITETPKVEKNENVLAQANDSHEQTARVEQKTKARQGDAEAQYWLGDMYYYGVGVPRDYKKAVFWWKKAAENEHVGAQYSLGVMYYHGRGGVPKDKEKAFYWSKKAAESEHAYAQHWLGKMYAIGFGVSKDREQANYWYKKSAENRNAGAKQESVETQANNSPSELQKTKAEQGDANAQWRLGDIYYYGEGVSEDFEKARYWREKAAENEHVGAQWELGRMYYRGEGVPKDFEKAFYWYKKSAENGHAVSQYNLGVMYYNGEGIPKDNEKAVYWLEKSAENGDPDAIKKLKEIDQQIVEQKTVAENEDVEEEFEIDWLEIEEEDSWYEEGLNWFKGLF